LDCTLGITLTCKPEEGLVTVEGTCYGLSNQLVMCDDSPLHLTFRYHAENCSINFNIQPASLSGCEDFASSLPQRAYITMTDLDDANHIVFSGFVNAGENFEASATDSFGNRFPENVEVSVFDPQDLTDPQEITQPENVMQTLFFDSSCSRNLFLNDRFGTLQVVEFVSLSGIASNFINATLQLVIDIPSFDGDSVELLSSLIHTNRFGTLDLASEITGMVFRDGDGFVSAPIPIVVDSSVPGRYEFRIEIYGRTINGMQDVCGDGLTSFTTLCPYREIPEACDSYFVV
jgi:hypothetical protein